MSIIRIWPLASGGWTNCILTEIRNEMTTANSYRMKRHKQIQLETEFIQL